MLPHIFGAVAGAFKVVGGSNDLDLMLQMVAQRIQFSYVLIAGMSGSQHVGTSQRISA